MDDQVAGPGLLGLVDGGGDEVHQDVVDQTVHLDDGDEARIVVLGGTVVFGGEVVFGGGLGVEWRRAEHHGQCNEEHADAG